MSCNGSKPVLSPYYAACALKPGSISNNGYCLDKSITQKSVYGVCPTNTVLKNGMCVDGKSTIPGFINMADDNSNNAPKCEDGYDAMGSAATCYKITSSACAGENIWLTEGRISYCGRPGN